MAWGATSSFLSRPLSAGGTINGDLVVTGSTTTNGPLTVPAGTAAAAAIRFAGSNAGTGFSAEVADILMLCKAGTEYLRLSASSRFQLLATLNGGSMELSGGIRVEPETVKTNTYAVTNSDTIVVLNGTSISATLPATPATNQWLYVKNINASPATIARNGKTIDEASADVTLLTGEGAMLVYNGTGWYVLIKG